MLKQQVEGVLSKYEKQDTRGILKKIDEIIQSKAGKWDKGTNESGDNLSKVLLYEYATALENITGGRLRAIEVIEKLSNQMSRLRFGNFVKGEDDEITYGNDSVTSENYQRRCRDSKPPYRGSFGAHAIFDTTRYTTDLVLFDNTRKIARWNVAYRNKLIRFSRYSPYFFP